MTQAEEYVINLFREFGIEANKIPESDEKSPDFYIFHGGRKILVELKTKLDNEETINSREEKFSQGEIHHYESVAGRRNTLSGIIKSASEQLSKQKKSKESEFCFVFILAAGVYSGLQMDQMLATLYGTKTVLELADSRPSSKECYYYTNSDFYNFRHIIDGAIVVAGERLLLCINDQSPNYLQAIETDFVKEFIPRVIDPISLERDGKVYLITENIDRKDEKALNSHLAEKYSLSRIIAFNFPRIVLTSRLELEEEDGL